MFANSHKIIAKNIETDILKNYDIKLDGAALAWGSVAPDILPKYKTKRHYREESLEYIVVELINLIQLAKRVNFYEIDKVNLKIFSNKLGIINHYLTDFVCIPHVERWTFPKNLVKHLKYESKLDKYVEKHNFNSNIIQINKLNIYEINEDELYQTVLDYILETFDQYSLKQGYENDLDFALALNLSLTKFILEVSNAYQVEQGKILLTEF